MTTLRSYQIPRVVRRYEKNNQVSLFIIAGRIKKELSSQDDIELMGFQSKEDFYYYIDSLCIDRNLINADKLISNNQKIKAILLLKKFVPAVFRNDQ
jgi:hypothetical protein